MTSTQTAVAISLAFVGGAAVGAAALYASDPNNRKKMKNALESSKRIAKRVPEAIQDVKSIASEAIVEARETAKEAIHDAGEVAKQVIVVSPALRTNGGSRM